MFLLFCAKYSLIDKFMSFEKTKYILCKLYYSPNRYYFHLVKQWFPTREEFHKFYFVKVSGA